MTASGRLDRREIVLLRLEDDVRRTGYGEGVPLTLRGGATIDVVAAEVEELARAVVGRTIADRDAIAELLAELGPTGPAAAALDLALHDLLAHAAGCALGEMLGGRGAPVRCNATIDAGEPDVVAAHARRLAGAGFGVVKVKVGTGDDAARVAAVRAAAGDAQIRLDANGAFDVEGAERLLDELGGEIELFEQPCATLEELAELRGRVEVPIVADESVASAADARRAAELGACDAATIKLSKSGGIVETLRIAEVLPTYLSSALDGPAGIAAAVHVASALDERSGPGFAHGLATATMFSVWPATGRPSAALLTPPRTPGIGVEIDRSALEGLRV